MCQLSQKADWRPRARRIDGVSKLFKRRDLVHVILWLRLSFDDALVGKLLQHGYNVGLNVGW